MSKKKLLIIAGPTAVGKTDISIALAQRLNGEIISADSMQIYKHMDIGSAKISKEEMMNVRHHLIDIIEPNESFSVAQFKEKAERAINEITERGNLPIMAGGTGLYINSVLNNYSFTDAYKDEDYRKELENLAEIKGRDYVHSLLRDIDKVSYYNIHPNNLKRVIRALEVFKITGKPFSQYEYSSSSSESPFNFKYYVLTMNREVLYNRINKRVDIMIEKGLLDEVKKLKSMGYTSDMQSMKGIGYKELLNYLDGLITYDEAIDSIKQGSRNYAKRQLTWFRKDERITWIDKDLFNNDNEIVDFIIRNYQ